MARGICQMLVAKTSPSEPPDLWAKTALIIEGCVVSGILSWQHKVDSETVSSLSFHPPTLSPFHALSPSSILSYFPPSLPGRREMCPACHSSYWLAHRISQRTKLNGQALPCYNFSCLSVGFSLSMLRQGLAKPHLWLATM